MNPNREHKNSVFTELFKEKSALLELYNALSNSDHGPDTKIETLKPQNKRAALGVWS